MLNVEFGRKIRIIVIRIKNLRFKPDLWSWKTKPENFFAFRRISATSLLIEICSILKLSLAKEFMTFQSKGFKYGNIYNVNNTSVIVTANNNL